MAYVMSPPHAHTIAQASRHSPLLGFIIGNCQASKALRERCCRHLLHKNSFVVSRIRRLFSARCTTIEDGNAKFSTLSNQDCADVIAGR